MTLKELDEYIEEGKRFIVVGDAVYYSPRDNQYGDPHDWYRERISRYHIPVLCYTTEEYQRDRRGLLPAAVAERVIDLWQAVMRILKSGSKKKDRELRGTCQHCGCKVACTERETQTLDDRDTRPGGATRYVPCPECGHQYLWVQ